MPSKTITPPILSSGLEASTSYSKASPASQTPANRSAASLASVHERWIDGLEQYSNMHLHAALSTFKRLLRELRISADAPNSPTFSVTQGEVPPHHTLLPEEVALLYINIGLIHGYLGSYYLSAAAFEEALLVDESSAISFFGLGIARFYLRELGASKRAFGRCRHCFDARAGGVRNNFNQEWTYRIWTRRPDPESKPSIIQTADASDPWQQCKSLFSRDFPDGVWTLAKARVEWNCRIVMFERNYVRKGVERPGGGKWGLNGIPAGVIFGPDTVAEGRDAIIRSSIDDSQPTNVVGVAKTVLPSPVGTLKSRTGSLVRQKWSLLQQKFLRKKSDESNQALPFTRPKSSLSSSSLRHSKQGPTTMEDKYHSEKDAPAQASHRHPGILKRTPPLIPSPVDSPRDEELNDTETQSEANPRTSPSHTPPPGSFPLRRSSLHLRSNLSSTRRRRGSLLAVDISAHSIQSIEEEPSEAQEARNPPMTELPYLDSPPSSSNISPKTLFPPRRHTEDIMLPTLINDLDPPPSNPLPTLPHLHIPDSVDGSPQFGYDSFMTDNISPLSPHVRSAMFPSISSSRKSSSSRRASYAVGTSRAHSVASEPQDSEEPEPCRRSSAIVTLTPASPERVHPPMTIPLLGGAIHPPMAISLPDSNPIDIHPPMTLPLPNAPVGRYDSPHSESPYFHDDAHMAPEPLSITKRKKNNKRISVTGRACLTEWEWVEEYERWRRDLPTSSLEKGDSEDDKETVGEILLPRRFEGGVV
ncbi:MAG: hypothetical protein Q9173_004366 [Seirophora scorigena]